MSIVAITAATTTTDASGNYLFKGLLPGTYTVTRSTVAGYGDVTDTDGATGGLNTVTVTIDKNALITTDTNGDLLGYQRADFVEGRPDLRLTKTANTLTPQLGGQMTFTLRVMNTGLAGATGVAVKDYLPAGVSYVSDNGGGAYNSGTGVWTVGSVAAGASASLNITVQVNSSAAMSNFAEVTACDQSDPDSTKNNDGGAKTPDEDDEALLTFDAQEADLTLSKTVDNVRPNVGGSVVFTLMVTNTGPDSATSVVVKDQLPAGLTYVSSTGTGSYNSATGLWTAGTVANGQTVTMAVTATVTAAAPISNFAEVYSADQYDPDSTAGNDAGAKTANEDDEARVTITPHAADLALSKSVSNMSPDTGGSVVFTLVLTNSGPDTAYDVVVNDLLPAGLTLTANSASTGTYTAGSGNWALASLAPGAVATLSLTTTVSGAVAITNTAYVSQMKASAGGSALSDVDSVAGANTGSDDLADGIADDDEASVTVTPGSTDLSLFKKASTTTPTIGSNVTFTLTVLNNGPRDAYHVRVSDALPAGLTYVSSSGTGTYSSGTGVWTTGTVTAGASVSIDIVATVTKPTTVNFAEIIEADSAAGDPAADGVSTLNDPDSTPNNDGGAKTANEDDEAAVTLVATGYADLQLSKAVNNALPGYGGTVTFTLTLTNTGISTATNIQVTDYISRWSANGAGDLQYVASSATSAAGTVSTASGNVVWRIPSLTYGQTVTLTLQGLTGASSGNALAKFDNDVTNFAEVTAVDQADPDSTKNNDAAAGTTNEDDEASATIYNPGSSRKDVALTYTGSVTRSGSPIGAGAALQAGDIVTYTLAAINQGSDYDNPSLIVIWPAGLNYASFTQSTTANGVFQYTTDADGLSATYTTGAPAVGSVPTYLLWKPNNSGASTKLSAGATETLTLTGTVNATGAGAGTTVISSAFWAAGNTGDADSSLPAGGTANPATNDLATDDLSDGLADDDEGTVKLGAGQRSDLSLAKAVSVDGGQNYSSTAALVDGQTVTFRVTLSNSGSSTADATNITVRDALPSGFTFVSSYGTGSYVSGTGDWTVAKMLAGQSVDLYVVATVSWGGATSITNFAQVRSADQTDTDSTPNNNATTSAVEDDEAAVTVTKRTNSADLTLAKSFTNLTNSSRTQPFVGDSIQYTLTLVNAGPDSATLVQVADTIPSGFTITAVGAPANWSYNPVPALAHGRCRARWLRVPSPRSPSQGPWTASRRSPTSPR